MSATQVTTGNLRLELTFGLADRSTDPALPFSGPTGADVAAVIAGVEALAAFSAQAIEFGVPLVCLLAGVDLTLRGTRVGIEQPPEHLHHARLAWQKIEPLYAPAISRIVFVGPHQVQPWFPRTDDEQDRFRPYSPLVLGELVMASPLDVLLYVPWSFVAGGGFWVFLKGLERAFNAPGRIRAEREVEAAREAAAQADRAEAELRRKQAELKLEALHATRRSPASLISGTVRFEDR